MLIAGFFPFTAFGSFKRPSSVAPIVDLQIIVVVAIRHKTIFTELSLRKYMLADNLCAAPTIKIARKGGTEMGWGIERVVEWEGYIISVGFLSLLLKQSPLSSSSYLLP